MKNSEKMFNEKKWNTNLRAQDISPERFLEIFVYISSSLIYKIDD